MTSLQGQYRSGVPSPWRRVHSLALVAVTVAVTHALPSIDSMQQHRDVGDSVSVSVHNVSNVFVVWDTRNTACEKDGSPIDLPDTPPNAFVTGKDLSGPIRLFSADTTTRVSAGPSILNIKRDCTIVLNSTLSPSAAMYATDEFIDATYAFDNGTVYALLHVEYPGMKFGLCPPNTTYPNCWTVAMTLAVSHDWGQTWGHALPPPHHMVAAPPYKYIGSTTTLNAGWGDSGGMVRSPTDGYFYAIVHNRFPEGVQQNGSCVMRTDSLVDPRSWRGWDGSAFTIPFASPYASDSHGYDPAKHACTVLDLPDCVVLGTVWSTYLEMFVASMTCGTTNGGDGGSAFYYATSKDMVHWSTPDVLFNPPFFHDDTFFSYPKLMDADAPSRGDRNFETIGQTATLFYVSVTHNFFTEGRQLYAVNITFDKQGGISTV
eukprot:m.74087 g.74087  ORF g.74087 m.74087 type:complete len:431 (-) comp8885_c0_seq2:79-1371(-)